MRFVVWEPFGDNDRYWIGPRPLRWVPEIEEVREAFARAPVLFDLPPEGPDEFRPFGISNRSLGMLGLVGGITFSWIVPDTRGAFVAWFLVGIGAAFHGLHLIFRYLARPNEQK